MGLEMNLDGRKALVTGVTSGIGAGIAMMLSKAGCNVAGCGLESADSPGAQQFMMTVQAEAKQAFYQQADLRLPQAPSTFVQAAAAELGGIDMLISNAGRNVFTGVLDCDEPSWQECMDLNLASHWRLARAAYPILSQGSNPLIIIISSNHAFSALPGCFPYNVAKAGLVSMVQALAVEWGPVVRAVGIAPAFVQTPAGDAWFKTFPDPAAARTRAEKLHPVHRLGTPEEIGALCAFLATDWGGFINGVTLSVDGGSSAVMRGSQD